MSLLALLFFPEQKTFIFFAFFITMDLLYFYYRRVHSKPTVSPEQLPDQSLIESEGEPSPTHQPKPPLSRSFIILAVLLCILSYGVGFIILIPYLIFRRVQSTKSRAQPLVNQEVNRQKFPSLEESRANPSSSTKELESFDGHKIESIPKYIELYKEYIRSNGSTFRDKLSTIIEYCKKFIQKKELISKSLLAYLDPNELSYIKFSSILNNIEDNVSKNLNDVLIHLLSFDEDEYERILKIKVPSKNYEERLKIFQEYVSYVDYSVEFIDSILIKLDKLQLEISKIKSIDIFKIEELQTVKDIDNLITAIKYYKV
jgi:hypothetical protein